jgi:hypothetical protein
MRLVKHPSLSLPIENLDSLCEGGQTQRDLRHGKLFPFNIRAIIAGPSGCGKTNLILSVLYEEHGLRFENIYLYSKTLYQPKYQVLNDIIAQVPEIEIFNYSDNEKVIEPQDAKTNSIFIFDDIICDKQDKIRLYFCMGRHKNIDAIYLTQTYTKIPKHLIRDNANVIIIFQQDATNLKHVYDEHVNTDMTFNEFKDICSKCWNDGKSDPLIIMKDFDINDGRYRKGFDKYICINY